MLKLSTTLTHDEMLIIQVVGFKHYDEGQLLELELKKCANDAGTNCVVLHCCTVLDVLIVSVVS